MTTTTVIPLSQFQKANIRRALLKNAQTRWAKEMVLRRKSKSSNDNVSPEKTQQLQQ